MQAYKLFPHANIRHIFGSENFAHLRGLSSDKRRRYFVARLYARAILDKNACSASQYPCGFQGSAELLDNAKYWPKNVIVMALAQGWRECWASM